MLGMRICTTNWRASTLIEGRRVMGHWEQIGVENRKSRERQAQWPRWRRELYRYGNTAIIAWAWIASVAIGLRLFGLL